MMNKRQRKKYLKSKGKYIKSGELWDLDYTFADFILPRLKAFKKNTISVPAQLSETEWNDILDKMILAFDYILDDEWWIDSQQYDYLNNNFLLEVYLKEEKRRNAVIEEGLELFAHYFRDLWI